MNKMKFYFILFLYALLFWKKRALVFSHPLGINGGTVALLELCESLKKEGFLVLMVPWYGSEMDVVKEFRKAGMNVCLAKDWSFFFIDVFRAIHFGQFFFNLYVCNAVNYNQLIPQLEKYNRRYIWWIHEGRMLQERWITPEIEQDLRISQHLYAVSELARQPLLKYNQNVRLLPLGISDAQTKLENRKSNLVFPFRFLVPGDICHQKAQDIVVEAYKRLGADYQSQCEIVFAGDNEHEFAKAFMNSCADLPGLHFIGNVPRMKVLELLSHSIAMLLTSRCESFSIVAVEGLMYDKPIIISDPNGSFAVRRKWCKRICFRYKQHRPVSWIYETGY